MCQLLALASKKGLFKNENSFLNVPMQGHINPTLPLVEKLVNEGHEIHYYCDEQYREKIEKRGATFKNYGIDFANMDPNSNPTMITAAHMFLKFAKDSIDKFLFEWKRENYDLIIHDSCAFAGVVLEKLLHVKAMNSTTTMFYTPEIIKKLSLDIALKDIIRSIVLSPLNWFRYYFLAVDFKKTVQYISQYSRGYHIFN